MRYSFNGRTCWHEGESWCHEVICPGGKVHNLPNSPIRLRHRKLRKRSPLLGQVPTALVHSRTITSIMRDGLVVMKIGSAPKGRGSDIPLVVICLSHPPSGSLRAAPAGRPLRPAAHPDQSDVSVDQGDSPGPGPAYAAGAFPKGRHHLALLHTVELEVVKPGGLESPATRGVHPVPHHCHLVLPSHLCPTALS